ncbi:MAG: hypothetical protein B0W54_15155 [Cellvibrio sp. 79]|nr:MAG: hypothetical protein B0W54_15155 [Cellvibrio sp. 79]
MVDMVLIVVNLSEVGFDSSSVRKMENFYIKMMNYIKNLFFKSKFRRKIDLDEIPTYVSNINTEDLKNFILNFVLLEEHEFVYIEKNHSRSEFNLIKLPNQISDFFSLFNSFSVRFSDLKFSRADIGKAKSFPALIRIGYDVEGYEVSFDTDGSVFLIDFDESKKLIKESHEKTIWHYITVNLLVVYPEKLEDEFLKLAK